MSGEKFEKYWGASVMGQSAVRMMSMLDHWKDDIDFFIEILHVLENDRTTNWLEARLVYSDDTMAFPEAVVNSRHMGSNFNKHTFLIKVVEQVEEKIFQDVEVDSGAVVFLNNNNDLGCTTLPYTRAEFEEYYPKVKFVGFHPDSVKKVIISQCVKSRYVKKDTLVSCDNYKEWIKGSKND